MKKCFTFPRNPVKSYSYQGNKGNRKMTYLEWQAECEMVDTRELNEWQEYCQTLENYDDV